MSDLDITSDLVKQLKGDFCVDANRLYASGHSNGGGFVNTLACSKEHGRQFAGFALVSAALYTDVHDDDNCDPSERVRPMFETHGSKDRAVRYDGGKGQGGPVPGIREWADRWSVRNQCESELSTVELAQNVTQLSWTCDGQTAAVRHIVIKGGSHAYPSRKKRFFVSPYIVDWFNSLEG